MPNKRSNFIAVELDATSKTADHEQNVGTNEARTSSEEREKNNDEGRNRVDQSKV